MYFTLMLLLSAVSMFFLVHGIQRKKASAAVLGLLLSILTFVFFQFFGFRGEALWFEVAGYSGRFGRPIAAQVLSAVGGGALAFATVWLLTLFAFPDDRCLRWLPRTAALVFGGMWGWQNWKRILFFWYGVSGEVREPILEADVGFYLFKLPLLDQLYRLLFTLFVLGLGTLLISLYLRRNRRGRIVRRLPDFSQREAARQNRLLYRGLAAFFFLLAWGKYLDRFRLIYFEYDEVGGADVHVRLHACRILIVFLAATGLFLLIPFLRGRFREWMVRRRAPHKIVPLTPALLAGFCTVVVWITALGIVPPLFERLHGRPGAISPAAPCMAHVIVPSRLEDRWFPIADVLTPERIEEKRVLVILIEPALLYSEPICPSCKRAFGPGIRSALRMDNEGPAYAPAFGAAPDYLLIEETPAVAPEEMKPMIHRSRNYEKD